MGQNPRRGKTGMCLRLQLLRLPRNVCFHGLERGRLYARVKPSHPLLGDIGEKPYLGFIAIKRCSGPSGIVSAGNLASPRCAGGQVKEIEPCAKNSTRKYEYEKHHEAQTTYGGRSIHAPFLFFEHRDLFYHVWGHSSSNMVKVVIVLSIRRTSGRTPQSSGACIPERQLRVFRDLVPAMDRERIYPPDPFHRYR